MTSVTLHRIKRHTESCFITELLIVEIAHTKPITPSDLRARPGHR